MWRMTTAGTVLCLIQTQLHYLLSRYKFVTYVSMQYLYSKHVNALFWFKNKKAQLSLTNPRDAWNPGHWSLKGSESDTIR